MTSQAPKEHPSGTETAPRDLQTLELPPLTRKRSRGAILYVPGMIFAVLVALYTFGSLYGRHSPGYAPLLFLGLLALTYLGLRVSYVSTFRLDPGVIHEDRVFQYLKDRHLTYPLDAAKDALEFRVDSEVGPYGSGSEVFLLLLAQQGRGRLTLLAVPMGAEQKVHVRQTDAFKRAEEAARVTGLPLEAREGRDISLMGLARRR